jgi:hypothetical protein
MGRFRIHRIQEREVLKSLSEKGRDSESWSLDLGTLEPTKGIKRIKKVRYLK